MRRQPLLTVAILAAVTLSGCSASRRYTPLESGSGSPTAPPRHSSEFDSFRGRDATATPRPSTAPPVETTEPPPVPPASQVSRIRSVGFLRDLGTRMRNPFTNATAPTAAVAASESRGACAPGCSTTDGCSAAGCDPATSCAKSRCGENSGTEGCTTTRHSGQRCGRGLLNRLFGGGLGCDRSSSCTTDSNNGCCATAADDACAESSRNGTPAVSGGHAGCDSRSPCGESSVCPEGCLDLSRLAAGAACGEGCGDFERHAARSTAGKQADRARLADPMKEPRIEWDVRRPDTDSRQPSAEEPPQQLLPPQAPQAPRPPAPAPRVRRGTVTGTVDPPQWPRTLPRKPLTQVSLPTPSAATTEWSLPETEKEQETPMSTRSTAPARQQPLPVKPSLPVIVPRPTR